MCIRDSAKNAVRAEQQQGPDALAAPGHELRDVEVERLEQFPVGVTFGVFLEETGQEILEQRGRVLQLGDVYKRQTLSAAARQDKATALNAKKQDLVNLGNKIQEMKTERGRELEEEKYRRHQEIVAEISKVINEYSGPQGYDLVLDKSSSSGTGISIVLYLSLIHI